MKKTLLAIAALVAIAALAQIPKPGSGGGGGASSLVAGTNYAKPSLSDTYANVAAATCGSTETGRIGFLTDSIFDFGRCSGSAWVWFAGGRSVTPFSTSGYTNFNTPITSTTGGGLLLSTAASGSEALRGMTKSIGGTYTIEAEFTYDAAAERYHVAGFCISDGTKYIQYGVGPYPPSAIQNAIYAVSIDYTTSSASLAINSGALQVQNSPEAIHRIKLQDNGTNRIFSYSPNRGDTYYALLTEGRTVQLTATTAGPCVEVLDATSGTAMSVLHWTGN